MNLLSSVSCSHFVAFDIQLKFVKDGEDGFASQWNVKEQIHVATKNYSNMLHFQDVSVCVCHSAYNGKEICT